MFLSLIKDVIDVEYSNFFNSNNFRISCCYFIYNRYNLDNVKMEDNEKMESGKIHYSVYTLKSIRKIKKYINISTYYFKDFCLDQNWLSDFSYLDNIINKEQIILKQYVKCGKMLVDAYYTQKEIFKNNLRNLIYYWKPDFPLFFIFVDLLLKIDIEQIINKDYDFYKTNSNSYLELFIKIKNDKSLLEKIGLDKIYVYIYHIYKYVKDEFWDIVLKEYIKSVKTIINKLKPTSINMLGIFCYSDFPAKYISINNIKDDNKYINCLNSIRVNMFLDINKESKRKKILIFMPKGSKLIFLPMFDKREYKPSFLIFNNSVMKIKLKEHLKETTLLTFEGYK
jgi:hypothetical protein